MALAINKVHCTKQVKLNACKQTEFFQPEDE